MLSDTAAAEMERRGTGHVWEVEPIGISYVLGAKGKEKREMKDDSRSLNN